jgi:hypothetical protein
LGFKMAKRRTIAALIANADDSTAPEVREQQGQMPLPTLDERVNFYLRAVRGDRRFTNQQYAEARDLILNAMADDIVARSNSRSAGDPSLLPIGVKPGVKREALSEFGDTSFLEAREQPRAAADFPEPAPVVAQGPDDSSPDDISERRLPALSLAGLFSRRTAAVCAATVVAAVAGYWVAGITARVAPNTISPAAPMTVQVTPPDPASGSPSTPRMVAEAEHELASALNTAQLDPDEIAALVKRGQELAREGRFRLARLVLERAAEAKSAAAAHALGRTYDPLTDRSAVHPDAPPDMAMARAWYEKAKDLGSTEAAQRLTQLPGFVPAPATRPSPR